MSGSEEKSRDLHVKNCQAYLECLSKAYDASPILQKNQAVAAYMSQYQKSETKQDSPEIYKVLIALLENEIDFLEENIENKSVQAFIFYIYHNDNEALERTYHFLSAIPNSACPLIGRDPSKVTHALNDFSTDDSISSNDSVNAGKWYSLAYEMLANNYKPQRETNIPTIRKYGHQQVANPIEYRFGTQAQRHKGQYQVSPLFKLWLKVAAKRAPNKPITHIYFNSLRYSGSGIPGVLNEQNMSQQLHALENDENLKVAVISLPSNGVFLHSSAYQQESPVHNSKKLNQQFLDIVNENTAGELHISESVRNHLKLNTNTLQDMINQSFTSMGLNRNPQLSEAQAQAVFFHFIKFELTNHIVETLSPNSINFSCKDAIDRGGIASLYYNLMLSFKNDKPMSLEEFQRGILAAPAMVKGRDMNEKFYILWNAVNHYINAHHDELLKDQKKSWLIYWRDSNCPRAAIRSLMSERIAQFRNKIEDNASEKNAYAHKIANNIEALYKGKTSDQRLLLKTLSQTEKLLHQENPDALSLDNYKELGDQLNVNPCFIFLKGLVQTFFAIIAYPFTLGKTGHYLNSGLGKCNTLFFSKEREDLIENLKEFRSKTCPEQ